MSGFLIWTNLKEVTNFQNWDKFQKVEKIIWQFEWDFQSGMNFENAN
jgi:hypothetical protein